MPNFSSIDIPSEQIAAEVRDIIRPRIIACVAGSYSGSSHALDFIATQNVIRITRTQACVIHTPKAIQDVPRHGLPADDLVKAFDSLACIVPLVNTSRANTAEDAMDLIYLGLRNLESNRVFSRPALIKLEILDHGRCLAEETLKCIRALPPGLQERCLPFLPAEPLVVHQATELGCPAVRILAGQVGGATGIRDLANVERAIGAAGEAYTILEGGIRSGADVRLVARLRADAVLVNSAFYFAADARALAIELRLAADESWEGE